MDESVRSESIEQNWIYLLGSARNEEEQNLEAIRAPDEMVYLRSTREILPREVLRVWFSYSLAREMGLQELVDDPKQG